MGIIIAGVFIAAVFVAHFIYGKTQALNGRQLRGELTGVDNSSQ